MHTMSRTQKFFLHSLAVVLSWALAATISQAQSGAGFDQIRNSVPNANAKSNGAQPTVIADGFFLSRVVTGTDPIENPSDGIVQFGLLNTGAPTEPDENTYVILDHNPGGPTAGYDYGRRFLYQGHENAANKAYVTRVNLDVADPAHRITLLTPANAANLTNFNSIDGSTFNPFTKTLLFTQEAGANGGVIEVTVDWPVTIRTLDGIIGKGGYEGIHPDGNGNLLIIEDAGGTTVNALGGAKQPNSFVYRFVPANVADLGQGGKLQAMQVVVDGTPITFHAGLATSDILSLANLKLHTLGVSNPVRWVTVHDTAVDGFASFNANARAKAAGATPLKRPENAQYLPGSGLRTFIFCETGDTTSTISAFPDVVARGGFGSIMRVDLDPSGETGKISIVFLGDAVHNSFDNLAFVDDRTLLAAEDRGDTLHNQLNALDSIWAFDVRANGTNPRRFVALGLDAQAIVFGEDNEPTGLHVSEGNSTVQGMQGKSQNPVQARWFFTQQHGNNTVWEILRQQ
jgi:hypothetical protein